ncbi:MAG: RNA polymerase sporulation sigma factor SigH [Armatimonadetes bacterium]|jgi:RNA polymerase sporulation-specific sigma factor|nr:RNA polymerase sporulation sigma factor SigH [Armatimonadota bacterium]MDI9585925.1 RNA polymerase sporulation sigma factor SigH [Acidobacteriota bacterium]
MAQLSEIDFVYGRAHARLADEELVAHAHSGCNAAVEYLLGKYRSLVEGKASAYFLAGADHDDVVQEGMIGLFKAIRDFSAEHLCAFRSFAELCITRQIITAVKTATRQKHSALNAYVSIDLPVSDQEEDRTFGETLVNAVCDGPEGAVAGRELQVLIRKRIERDLSRLESGVLLRYLEGKSYGEIASDLGLQVKQVDNALQRAKKKLARCSEGLSTA